MNAALLKFGTINDTDSDRQMARVLFDENGITSDWLPYIVKSTVGTREVFPLPVNSHVACLMDCHCEGGVILGPVYSDADQPTGATGTNLFRVVFTDGSEMQYDAAGGVMYMKTGTTEVTIGPAGITMQRGSETLKSLLSDLIDAILAETHTTSSGPSGTPINAAQYTAIKNRLPNLFQN